MESIKLQLANELQKRINKLSLMQRDLRPEHTNGVGVRRKRPQDDINRVNYEYNLWSTHASNTDDDSLIMRVGIAAMYDKVSSLLKDAEKDLKDL